MLGRGSGLSQIWAHISKRNIESMLAASVGALVLISGKPVVALRSLKYGLLSLVPNLAPGLMAFGVWGITVEQVGLAVSVIVSLTRGIIVDDTVDDTIHFLIRHLHAWRERRMNPEGAVRYAFSTVG